MSRGPGIWQRQILEPIEAGKVVILTSSDHTQAEQNAIRRAAYTLERAGRVQLISHRIDGRARLVACPLDMPVPEGRTVVGLDGKTYRQPGGFGRR